MRRMDARMDVLDCRGILPSKITAHAVAFTSDIIETEALENPLAKRRSLNKHQFCPRITGCLTVQDIGYIALCWDAPPHKSAIFSYFLDRETDFVCKTHERRAG